MSLGLPLDLRWIKYDCRGLRIQSDLDQAHHLALRAGRNTSERVQPRTINSWRHVPYSLAIYAPFLPLQAMSFTSAN
jgi:hypothetical protein